jgi:hypothetical protein
MSLSDSTVMLGVWTNTDLLKLLTTVLISQVSN